MFFMGYSSRHKGYRYLHPFIELVFLSRILLTESVSPLMHSNILRSFKTLVVSLLSNFQKDLTGIEFCSVQNMASIPSNNNIIVNNGNDSVHFHSILPTGTSSAQLLAVDSLPCSTYVYHFSC